MAHHDQYVVVRRFIDLPQALAAKSALHSSGIESFLADENASRIMLSNLGGIRLFVKHSDAEAAAVALVGAEPQGG